MNALDEDDRDDALIAFLGAGLPQLPTRVLMVQALADARREVAACQVRRVSVEGWLADHIRVPGIKEAAAFAAALEIIERPADYTQMYRTRHPDRRTLLDRFLATLNP